MFFRNLTLFRFPTSLDLSDLETHLAECALKPVGPMELSSRGFVPPFGQHGDALIHGIADVAVPMDETLSRCAIDISGRPYLVFRTTFATAKIGTFDTQLVEEWFRAFAFNAGLTLHIETFYGANDHHIAESCFKALARALRQAVAIDPAEAGRVPSTKGVLEA